ncbi:MAG: hypothetical protein MR002_00600, partial [Acholeplasmatales bacterium]|nr:hypothetical protein [Acholeplasmatales bacterium]
TLVKNILKYIYKTSKERKGYMKSSKLKYYITMILISLSLISIGFASWTISNDVKIKDDSIIIVDDVMKYNDYLSYTLTPFSYYKTGFVSNTGELTNDGIISVELVVNIDNCKTKFTSSSLELELTLRTIGADTVNLFNNADLPLTVSINGTVLNDSQVTKNNTSAVTKYVINDLSQSSLTLSFEYKLTKNDSLNFQEIIYNTFYNKEVYFGLSAKITEVE